MKVLCSQMYQALDTTEIDTTEIDTMDIDQIVIFIETIDFTEMVGLTIEAIVFITEVEVSTIHVIATIDMDTNTYLSTLLTNLRR